VHTLQPKVDGLQVASQSEEPFLVVQQRTHRTLSVSGWRSTQDTWLQGIEDAEESIKAALISFTIHMADGDAAAATAAMRAVRGRTAWRTMARVAVRSRRAEVLALCLDHMEHLAAAQAFRESKAAAERSAAMERRAKGAAKGAAGSADGGAAASKGDMAAMGMAAVHLGMEEEALEILRQGECWHELVDVLQVRCPATERRPSQCHG